jgi:biopolymer transport protein TolR
MGATISNPNGGGRGTPTVLAEINVTPLVDVMLVLLIIFMVTAPLLQQGVQVDLPKAEAGNLGEIPGQIDLVIDRSERILLNNQVVPRAALGDRLDALASQRPDIAVYIQADAAIPYGTVAQILSEVRKTRIHHVGLVTEAPEKKRRP